MPCAPAAPTTRPPAWRPSWACSPSAPRTRAGPTRAAVRRSPRLRTRHCTTCTVARSPSVRRPPSSPVWLGSLPHRYVAPALGSEGSAGPVAPPSAQGEAGQSRHQVQLSGPYVAERRGEGLELAARDPVVMGDGDLSRYVVLLETQVLRGDGEGMKGLSWRQPLKLRYVNLDDEAPAWLQL